MPDPPRATALPDFPPQPAGLPWPTADWPVGAPVGPAVLAHVEAAFADGAEAAIGQTSAVLVVQGGRLRLARYGPGIDPAATFPSWSMCKTVLATAIGLLIRDGRLALEEPVARPEWDGPGDRRSELTVLDLLHMKASLRWAEEYSADVESDVVAMLFGPGAADTAAFVAAKPLVGPPGTVYEYSSGTSNLLAWVFGRAFDHDPAAQTAYLRRELFDPIGMRSALPKFDEAGTWIGSTYCFATAEDFARFGLLLLRGGRWEDRDLLPPGYVDALRTPQTDVHDEGWGYGRHTWTRPEAGGFFACRGYQAQYVFLAPASDTMVVRLGVTPEDRKRACAEWAVELLELAAADHG